MLLTVFLQKLSTELELKQHSPKNIEVVYFCECVQFEHFKKRDQNFGIGELNLTLNKQNKPVLQLICVSCAVEKRWQNTKGKYGF